MVKITLRGVLVNNMLVLWPECQDHSSEHCYIGVVYQGGEVAKYSRTTHPSRWKELREFLPDDAVYFQPEGAGEDNSGSAADIASYEVYRDFETAQGNHPDCRILAYTKCQIGDPVFLDVETPDRVFSGDRIERHDLIERICKAMQEMTGRELADLYNQHFGEGMSYSEDEDVFSQEANSPEA